MASSTHSAITPTPVTSPTRRIAECVEDEKVLAALKLLKVGYAQGFGLRKPEPIDDLFKS